MRQSRIHIHFPSVCRQVFFSALICLFTTSLSAENWPRFRGPNGTGLSGQKGIPVTWSPGDYAWNIELPGIGHAAPIIWEDRVFVTSAADEGALRFLICLDAATGEKKWLRRIGMNRSHKHLKNSWASSTPTTDGERVYAAWADKESYFVEAYSLDGNLLWRRNLGDFESQHGLGVSPIIYNDLLIVANDQDGPSFIFALDRETGATRWSTIRSIRRTSYASPLIFRRKDGQTDLICVSGAMGIAGLNPDTGNINWFTGEFPLRTVASPVYGDGVVIASCGQGGRYGVLQIAVEPPKEGEAPTIRWTRKKVIPYVPTPIIYEGHLYEWSDEGILACVDLATGENLWVKRIGGKYSSSPICIDGKMYGISEAGEVVVVAASPEFQFLGKTALGDASHSSPAIANGRLYLRTYHRLACLEAKE